MVLSSPAAASSGGWQPHTVSPRMAQLQSPAMPRRLEGPGGLLPSAALTSPRRRATVGGGTTPRRSTGGARMFSFAAAAPSRQWAAGPRRVNARGVTPVSSIVAAAPPLRPPPHLPMQSHPPGKLQPTPSRGATPPSAPHMPLFVGSCRTRQQEERERSTGLQISIKEKHVKRVSTTRSFKVKLGPPG